MMQTVTAMNGDWRARSRRKTLRRGREAEAEVGPNLALLHRTDRRCSRKWVGVAIL